MKQIILKYNMFLFITAFIWGIGFIFQQQGAATLGPFLFCTIRYFLGGVAVGIVLIAIALLTKTPLSKFFPRETIVNGTFIGFFLFIASILQQAGLKYTTAGNAGFITEVGIAFVPVMAIFLGERPRINVLAGAALVIIGLYMLTKPADSAEYNRGDLLELCSAFFWAVQLMLLDRKAPAANPFALSLIQFISCTVFCMITTLLFETINLDNIKATTHPLLYTGIMSCGVAFTLQVIAQRKTPAIYTAMILSLEAIFAALAGWLYLHEDMSTIGIAGCTIMLIGILLAQAHIFGVIRKQTDAHV
ncbi:MAG: DMT family transporter [Endozoicomonadaceae bacterium]|nr:DMT family transporter [Endozoicomonadaceae bacterium]